MSTRTEIDGKGFPTIPARSPKVPQPSVSDQPLTPASTVPELSVKPAAVDPGEWARRMDAVRDAAREFEQLSAQDIKERLRGVTSRPLDPGAIAQFQSDVQAAQLSDLVDILDQAQRGTMRSRRTVRVQAPRNYKRKALHSLDDAQVSHVAERLRARGWGDADIKSGLVGKFSDQRASTLPKDL